MTNEKKRLVPELRFRGFTDDWEQRKLGDLGFDISDGDWIESAHIFDDGEYRIIQTGNIGVDEYLDKPKNAKYFHKKDFDELRANEIFAGDIVICRLADPAGRATVVPALKQRMVTSVDVAILRPRDNISTAFLVAQLNSPHNLNQVSSMASGSTRTRISRKNLEKETLFMPNSREQKKIGNFITNLTNTIALHHRKHEALLKLKEAYLQKLFPEKDNKYPVLRFAGFTDAWEQRKLGDVVNRLKSYPLSRDVETTENSGYRYVHYGDIHTRVADVIDDEGVLPQINPGKYEPIQTGDLCLADASEDYQDIAAPSVLLAEHKDNVVAGLHTIALRPDDADPLFLYFLFKAPDFRHYVYREGQGLKVFGISARGVLNYTYAFPSMTEQAKIVKLLRSFDTTIALHQRKLEKLQELKKGYLQKMFC